MQQAPAVDLTALPANITRTQWNNRLKTILLMCFSAVGVVLFVAVAAVIIISAGYVIACVVEGRFIAFDYSYRPEYGVKLGRLVLKVTAFIALGTAFFVQRAINNVALIFDAQRLELKSGDPFYRQLENLCIERGLAVPDLYVLPEWQKLTTAVVVQGFSRKWALVLSPEALRLEPDLLQALLAQAVHRVHTKDTLFLTLFCFLGYFPFHMRESMGKIRNALFYVPLKIADAFLALFRPAIMDLRTSRLDMGSLKLTKDAAAMSALLERLSTYDDIETYYHAPYLSLFIAKSENDYRQKKLTPSFAE